MDELLSLTFEIAIVGMASRFPGLSGSDDLRLRVRDGDDCLQDLTADDLRAAGADEQLLASPDYVRRSGMTRDAAIGTTSGAAESPARSTPSSCRATTSKCSRRTTPRFWRVSSPLT